MKNIMSLFAIALFASSLLITPVSANNKKHDKRLPEQPSHASCSKSCSDVRIIIPETKNRKR